MLRDPQKHSMQLEKLLGALKNPKWPQPDADEDDSTYTSILLDAWADDVANISSKSADEVVGSVDVANKQALREQSKLAHESTKKWNSWLENFLATNRGLLRRIAKVNQDDPDLHAAVDHSKDVEASAVKWTFLAARHSEEREFG